MAEIPAKRVDGRKAIDAGAICYGKAGDHWFISFPEEWAGINVLDDRWHITENPDGTITAYPSIRVSDGTGKQRHGWLINGVWNCCTDEVLS